MRLTLRTLLSYLDNVLDAPSRAELQRQIEASEHASEWVHRTRDVTRRLKLGAPEPAGTGSIDDPNTVAEYLDRALPEEGVAEFERVCLESDVMLAEVASCHHVLAMFLSEPPEIDPDTRQRLYRLQADLEAALKQPAAPARPVEPAPVDLPVAELAPQRRVRPVAPRVEVVEEQGGFWSDLAPWAPAIAALALLAATAFLVLNNDTGTKVVKSGTPAESQELVTPPGPAEAAPPKVDGGAEAQPAAGETATSAGANPAADAPSEAAPGDAVEPAPGVTAPTETAPMDTTPAATGPAATGPAATGPAVPAPGGAVTPPPPTTVEPAAEEPATEPSATGQLAAVTPPPPEPMDDAETAPATGETDATSEEPEAKAMLTFVGDAPPPNAVRSGPQARRDPNGFVVVEAEGNLWRRLQQGMFTEAPQRGHVISMPGYRGAFELSQGVQVELVDQTEAVLDPDKPGVELLYGRLVLSSFPTVKEPIDVTVRIDSVDYTLRLSPGASVAIAADRFYDAGRQMLEDPAPMVAIAHALEGESVWKTPNSERTSAMPAPLFFVSGRLTGPPAGFRDADWVTDVAVTEADRESAPYVAAQVGEGSVVAQLLALADAKNSNETRDVVSLASRCSAALKQPDALVASFEDKAQAEEWGRHLDTLRQIASRSVAGAEAVRMAFVDKYGEAGGGALFAVVQGFTPSQVGADAAAVQAGVIPAVLLPMLESEDLATRVLGSTALFELIEHRLSAKDLAVSDRAERRRFLRRVERDVQQGELALLPR